MSEIPMRPIKRRLEKLLNHFRGIGLQGVAPSREASSVSRKDSRTIEGLKTGTEPKASEAPSILREKEGS